jgi:hypothetical protein
MRTLRTSKLLDPILYVARHNRKCKILTIQTFEKKRSLNSHVRARCERVSEKDIGCNYALVTGGPLVSSKSVSS